MQEVEKYAEEREKMQKRSKKKQEKKRHSSLLSLNCHETVNLNWIEFELNLLDEDTR